MSSEVREKSKKKEKRAQKDDKPRKDKQKRKQNSEEEHDRTEDQSELRNGKSKKRKSTSDATFIENKVAVQEQGKPKRRKLTDTISEETTEAPETTATASRFIVFIGNLPYTATTETITSHFAALKPFSVRAPTDPKTKKSKGYAFLEFEGFDRMKTCLKKYHHSIFGEDVNNPSSTSNASFGRDKKADKLKRRINVELTAGGGGRSAARMEKVKLKNEKLADQRKRGFEEEQKVKMRQDKKKSRTPHEQRDKEEQQKHEDDEMGAEDLDIHPSRMRLIQH